MEIEQLSLQIVEWRECLGHLNSALRPSQFSATTPKRALVAAKKAVTSKQTHDNPLLEDKQKRLLEFSTYIYKVLKQVHPNIGISSRGMTLVNRFVNDVFDRIVADSALLARFNNHQTLSSREIQIATRLILPGELCKHAVTEATKVVQKYRTATQ